MRKLPLFAAAFLWVAGSAGSAKSADLDDLVGCWVTPDPSPVSRLTDGTDPNSAATAETMSLLLFNRIRDTDYLVFGSLFEWSEDSRSVSGPVFKNGVFDPLSETLTFGSPGGGFARAHLTEDDTLIYTWTVSSAEMSVMSVREMERVECDDARQLSEALLERQRVSAD
ncbi:hypothetical protein [Nitratireductor sp. XY-223]|uniref:hypothetical protein n=1 Tax=Nitratireductor sp. XY-223 TaxID=2561926 RepID=UPI0010AACDC7|nr:hypothetical protein [Nitratireductor sp. XY-223]